MFCVKSALSVPLDLSAFLPPHSLQIPGFCEGGMGSSLPGVKGQVNCDVLVGYKAVYRTCFGMAMFFLLFSLLMIKVRSSQDPRASLHNGYAA